MKYAKLQNGSDVRGVAIWDELLGQAVNLTNDAAANIAAGFGLWLCQLSGKPLCEMKLGVGRDSRLSGEALSAAVCGALRDMGATVYDCGLASTPAMFMTTVTQGYLFDGAIMITASHLPYNRNGLKFFTAQGGTQKSEVTQILTLAEQPRTAQAGGSIQPLDFISVYAAILVDFVRAQTGKQTPLQGKMIAVDAGNGAGGFYAGKVLQALGADTTCSQFLEPDGTFPNHIPNPEDETAMQSIVDCVLRNHADFGIIFDTDVDRAGAVDEAGSPINKNKLIAMISAILLEQYPGTTIVTDSITSTGLGRFIAQKGGMHHRFKRGYKNVIDESIRLNGEGIDSAIAIETSGHGALKENYFLDDGAYLITKLLVKLAQVGSLGYLIADLQQPLEESEIRLRIQAQDYGQYADQVLLDLADYALKQGWQVVPKNFEGIRVQFGKEQGDGWFLLRKSLHDPIMPLNIQSDSQGGVQKIQAQLQTFLQKYDALRL